MPGSAGVVQEAGVPLRPSISTRQSRQEPKGSRESVAQSFGIVVPDIMAAAMTEVPSGTLTSTPSMVSETRVSLAGIGVPKSISLMRPAAGVGRILVSYSAATFCGARRKSSGK